MATPLLRALKRYSPDREIYWLVDRHYAGALEGNPLIAGLIPFDSGPWRRLMRRGNLPAYLAQTLALRRRLRDLRLDLVINLHADKWWSAWFNVAPERVGVFYKALPGPLSLLYTRSVPQTEKPKRLHNSEHYTASLAAVGIHPPYDLRLVAAITPDARREAEQFLRDCGIQPDASLLVLHPGTSRPSKNWLPEQYAALARLFPEQPVIITGDPSERPLADRIAKLADRPRVHVAAGILASLAATAALIDRADAVVTGDTAVLHLASALDTPLVGIYGSTRPRSNAPLFGPSRLLYDDHVPCSPCYLPKCPLTGAEHMRCMRVVTPEAVADALRSVAQSDGSGSSRGKASHETNSPQ